MKKLIKEWLGITDLPEYIKRHDMKEEIKEAVEAAIIKAFKEEPNEPVKPLPNYKFNYKIIKCKDIRGTLERQVKKILNEDSRIAAEKAIEDIVYRENFINDIVKRIKDKQL